MSEQSESPPQPEPSRASKVAASTGRMARLSGRAARRSVVTARRMTHAQGAGESGLSRLLEMHAFSVAGDAAVAVALAGTLFFTVPGNEARGDVAQFLGLTMLPFAIVAPLIGPFLDRFRRGRRWAIGATMAVRAFCCWVLAGAVSSESAALFPAALGVLVASKAYGVTKASAVPRVLPRDFTLVKANSRISLVGTAGAVLSAPLAGLAATVGSEWALRYAFVLFTIATVLAVFLPSVVDSSEGEEQVAMAAVGGAGPRASRVTPDVVTALRCNAGLRFLTGFLIMFMAFLLRDQPFEGWEDRRTLLLGLVVGAAGAGNTLGTVVGNLLKGRNPVLVVRVTLIADVVVVAVTAVFYGLLTAVVLGLVAGLAQSLGKLGLDALIQRDIPEVVRTAVFARSETLLQLSWVVGGFVGILLPLNSQLGLGVASAVLVIWAAVVLRADALRNARSEP